MKLNLAKENDVTILSGTGSLDVSVQNHLKDRIDETIHAGVKDLIFDFSEITFIDSSCLGILVSATKNLRESKGDIKLSNLSEDVRSIFQITRLDRIFEIFDLKNEAIDSYFR
ncbi:hypothetical protein BVY03_06115 [bacterium K02(2017)]|nr:hypothetical protein BVY03_06115 [bacterium K02(2017)]